VSESSSDGSEEHSTDGSTSEGISFTLFVLFDVFQIRER
jgi:hypothetical protein